MAASPNDRRAVAMSGFLKLAALTLRVLAPFVWLRTVYIYIVAVAFLFSPLCLSLSLSFSLSDFLCSVYLS